MRFARIIFWCAGAWGILVLLPLYFALDAVGRSDPPAVTHPEFYFGFIGVALVWQFAFFVIGSAPLRFRPMMLIAMAEKFVHVAGMAALLFAGRINGRQFAVNLPDLVWGILFVVAYLRMRDVRSIPK